MKAEHFLFIFNQTILQVDIIYVHSYPISIRLYSLHKNVTQCSILRGLPISVSKQDSQRLINIRPQLGIAFYSYLLQLEMKKQDQTLASEFLRIKQAIYNLKLEWSCEDHQCMLEGAETEMDVLEELRRVTDLPLQKDIDMSLKEKGFTKLNVCSRRYTLA